MRPMSASSATPLEIFPVVQIGDEQFGNGERGQLQRDSKLHMKKVFVCLKLRTNNMKKAGIPPAFFMI